MMIELILSVQLGKLLFFLWDFHHLRGNTNKMGGGSQMTL